MAQIKQTIQVTAAIIQKDQKIFIARRSANKHLAGYWEFPGGKIENGETDEECLSRELKEELSIVVNVQDFFMENKHDYGQKEIILKAYFCEFISGEIILTDHDQYAWVDRSELESFEFAPADVPFIKAINAL